MEVAALGLKVEGVSGIDKASASLDKFSGSAGNAERAAEGLQGQSKTTTKALADAAREGDKSSASMSRLAGAAKLAAGIFAGFKLTSFISEITLANSRFEQLGLVMNVVGRNASLSEDQISSYAKQVESMGISMTESRQTVIRMIQAQMDLSKASSLARLAQDAAVIANTNSSDALSRLIYGLQSGQVEILRNMGLNVNFANSYKNLADQLGVTTDQLSEADKVQARTNAVMAAGAQIAGAYDASMENAGKQLGSTTRYLQDLGVMWGEVFSDAASEAIFGYSDALKGLHQSTKEMQESGTLAQWGENVVDAMRSAADVAAIAGIAIVSKLVAATGASAVAFAAATIESIRYQMALARMAGVSTTAAVRLTALSVAARAASSAMALVGGPAGAIMLAGGALAYFTMRTSEAERESEALDSRINKLNGTFNKLNADQAAAAILDYDAKLAAATFSMQTAEARAFTLSRNLEQFPNSKKAEEWAKDLIRAKGAVGDAADEVNTINAMLSQLNGIVQSGGVKHLGEETTEASEAFTKLNSQLLERLELIGLSTEADKLSARVSNGYIEGLLDGEGEILVALQRQIDARELSEEQQKNLLNTYDQILAQYHRQVTLGKEATEVEQLLYEVQYGRLKGLQPEQQKVLEGLAAELDARAKLASAAEAGKQFETVMTEVGGMTGNSEIDRLNEVYERRKEIIDNALNAEYLSKAAHEAAMLKLDEQTSAARSLILEEQAEQERQAALQTMANVVSITQSQIQQMQGLLAESTSLGKAFFAVSQALAAANAIVQGYQSAMAIRTAYATMASTAGFGASSILAAGEVHANVAQGMGFATAGLIMGQAISGFQSGGYTGNAGTSQVAGVVHGQEYVFDAQSTSRIGVANLEAMRKGKAVAGNVVQFPSGKSGGNSFTVHAPVTVEGQAGMTDDQARQQGESVASAVQATIVSTLEKESRPGGMLWQMYGAGR